LIESSAIVVAWNDAELAALPGIVEKAHKNGVKDVRAISQTELRLKEPKLANIALGGVFVPGEHIIDPWSAPLAYAHQALAHGAVILRNAEVTDGTFAHDAWTLASKQGKITASVVVNAAGNFGDLVELMARLSPFTIKPRKGQFVVFDKPAYKLLRAIILPVPTARTKGVVLFRTAFGNLAIGPTAEDQDEREIATCDQETLRRLRFRAIAMVPALANIDVSATYAGLRPASEHKDYVIEAVKEKNWITVGGIRSTGLTASLGIADYVCQLYDKNFGSLPKKFSEQFWTPVSNLSEGRIRPYMKGGEIICHCEHVTRGEIETALEGPLPAGDMGGLKRRTRAMMGRCQGFYCSAHIAQITKGRFDGKP
jgi:glycerol-3-phosphate dehydrogenase